MSTPEDRYCSDCGFGDYCMRERSCYRRDQGEIRSVEERGGPDLSDDEPLPPHWSESPFWRGVFAREAAAAEACGPECGPPRGSTSLTMRGSCSQYEQSEGAAAPANAGKRGERASEGRQEP